MVSCLGKRPMSHEVAVSGLWLVVVAQVSLGQSAVRDLPDIYVSGTPTGTVTIAINPPPEVAAVGLEDKPPSTSAVLSVSDNGSLDVQSGKVKWGPFLAPSIPTSVTYEISSPPSAPGEACFSGTVSFDGVDEPIIGDACLPPPIPAVSAWGIVLASLLTCIAGTLVLRRVPSPVEPHPPHDSR